MNILLELSPLDSMAIWRETIFPELKTLLYLHFRDHRTHIQARMWFELRGKRTTAPKDVVGVGGGSIAILAY